MATARAFAPAVLDGVDEPVRRRFLHAIADGAPLEPRGVRLTMRGRIRVGRWLPFTAVQSLDADALRWEARVALGPLTLLRVVDAFAGGEGRQDGYLFGRRRVMHAQGDDVTRSAAGRVALECAMFAPTTLLPGAEIEWHAEADDVIAVRRAIGPERPEVRIGLDAGGAVRWVVADRWGGPDGKAGAYVPCGGEVEAERRFGDLTVPSAFTVGWGYGTPAYAPFFRAEITALERA
jgi:hypothetical protein